MILHKKTKLKIRIALRKSTSLMMAFVFLFQITYPTQAWALTGGPSQPEVQSFEPIGTSDMVDLFTGDFNYNIPLMDVDGYPINIAYHSTIGMDQEASWTGLGWNINPGVINRNMRGLPDDFNGELVSKELNIKPNKTWGVAVELQLELYGYEGSDGASGSINLGYSFGFNYNNYTGPSISQGLNLSLSAGSSSGGALNAGLGLNSSSDDGLSIQPSVGFSASISTSENTTTSIGVNIGTSFNSRGGLKQLSINVSASTSYHTSGGKGVKNDDGSYKKDSNGEYEIEGGTSQGGSASMGSVGVGGTFDFGTPSYTPSISNSMKTYGLSGKFTLGGELWGIHGKIGVSGFFTTQKLASAITANPAYGYLYSENGQLNDAALMDFNREKDGAFSEGMACLPVANYTFDTYSVSGQGIGGSYRPFRSDIGYVFDPAAYTTNDDASLTVEIGFGGYVHVGTNLSVTDVSGNSGKWKNGNNALNKLRFSKKGKGNDFENVYFKEANEKTVESDSAFYASVDYDNPVSPSVDFSDKYEPVCNGFGPAKRKKRDKRTQNMYFLTKSEYADLAEKPVTNSYSAMSAPGHHIAEVTTLGTDGSRYVYGIAAYNTTQQEVSFAVGSADPANISTNVSTNPMRLAKEGLVDYSSTDNSSGNSLGIDNFFSKTTTPGYAHSYLMTAVLSPDYIDADAQRGPSDGDYGNYTRFAYKKIDNYQWRTPFNDATYTEGLKSESQDDKANYIYGVKELWYLDSVITKNYVAVFHTSDRIDGVGVQGPDGGYVSGVSKKMKQLDSISMYSKADIRMNGTNAVPLKRVHFVYDNSLCKGIPNVSSGVGTTGKLTLKEIFFTYQNSNKARMSPYKFSYDGDNPDYNIKAYDRWGNFKPNNATTIGVAGDADVNSFITTPDLAPSDYPYVEQDQTTADQYSSAWSLTSIQLPSGGKITMDYESDDYAYVQNKQAMEMFKIVNPSNPTDNNTLSLGNVGGSINNDTFYFKLQKDKNGNYIGDKNKYFAGIEKLYFRFLVKIRDVTGLWKHLEYVSGYGNINYALSGTDTTTGLGHVVFQAVEMEKSASSMTNPIIRTAVQFARLYMPKKAYTNNYAASAADAAGIEGGGGLGLSILNALINSSFIKNIKDAIAGPNDALYFNYDVAHEFVTNKSWVRLMDPKKQKLGGGSRVSKIRMVDEWDAMTNVGAAADYGQEYDYTLDDGTSSGVALMNRN